MYRECVKVCKLETISVTPHTKDTCLTDIEGDRVNQSTRSSLRLAAAILLLCASASAWSFGLRCGSRVISTGMLETQVQGACGAPFWTDEFSSLEIFGAGGPIEEQREVNWQVWYYNFGS